MFVLRLLGGISVQSPCGVLVSGSAAQRHRLGLLAVLALRGTRPTSRDMLLGLLWPEKDSRFGRRLLNLAVHALRQVLGRNAIRSVTDGLVLDPGFITSDVAEFEAATSEGDGARAVSCYQGPFLEGFFLPCSPEFDRWADATRAHFAGRYATLLEALARARESAGDWRGAVDWWQRLFAMNRGNGVVVRRLMLALEAMRDRASALEQARLHTQFMADEAGAGPDPLVAALARSLATGASTRSQELAQRQDLKPVAVLPFLEVGLCADDEGFGEGIAFEVRHRLATAGLRLADSSGLTHRGRQELSVQEIGARLGVSAVLEGTVRRNGWRVRVQASLVETLHGFHLWSCSYERRAGDPFRLQEELGAEIALGVEPELDNREVQSLDLDSRGLILRGRFALGRRTASSLRTAARYFSAALSQDPGDSDGFSALAEAYAVTGFYNHAPPAEAFGSARRAAREALRLDPRSAAPRATLADVDLYYRWNLPLAEARFRRAIAADPQMALGHQWYGNLLVAAGRKEESICEMKRAVVLDPQSLVAGAGVGQALYFAGKWDEAIEQCGSILELDPNFGPAHLWRSLALQEVSRWDESIRGLEQAREFLEGGAQVKAALARATAAAGDRACARRMLDELEAGSGYLPPYEVAKGYLALGAIEKAFDWLDCALANRAHSMVLLRVDPQLADLRDHPRFGALVSRVFLQAGGANEKVIPSTCLRAG